MVLIFQLKNIIIRLYLKAKLMYIFSTKNIYIYINSWEKNSGVKLLILRKHILVSDKVYIKMMTISGIKMVFS